MHNQRRCSYMRIAALSILEAFGDEYLYAYKNILNKFNDFLYVYC